MRYYRDLHPTFKDQELWNLPAILRLRGQTHGDHIFLDIPHQKCCLSFSETLTAAEHIGRGLLASGSEQGDRMLIMSPNRAEVILAWFGSAIAGIVEVPLNTAYSGTFLEHQVRTTRPRVGIIHADYADRFSTNDAFASLEQFYVIGDSEDEIERANVHLRNGGWASQAFDTLLADHVVDLPVVRSQDLGSIFFTSGTTGLSKGVMMSHSHMTFFADEGVSLTKLTETDTYMSVGPLFHGNAQFLAVYPSLIVGARCVLQERFSASRWAEQIRSSRATVTNLIGVMMDWTWKQPEQPDDANNQLRCVWAVPTASAIADRFKQRFGIEAFVENFGLTETSMPILVPYGVDRPSGAAGLLADEYFDVRLVDPETDQEVPVGELGELVVRTKLPWTMCSGYYNMPEQTAAAQRNLWFHTGDGLRRDAEGWYYFVDRLKDSIRRCGENISSYEIEQAMLENQDVAECAVVAAPADSLAGEDEVAVFVVVKKEAELCLDDLRQWCDDRLPAFARPEYISIIDTMPMTPSGKVRKVELREIARNLATSNRHSI